MQYLLYGAFAVLLVYEFLRVRRYCRYLDVPVEGVVIDSQLGTMLWRLTKLRGKKSAKLIEVDIFLLNPPGGIRTGLRKVSAEEECYPKFNVSWFEGFEQCVMEVDPTRWELPGGYRIASVRMLKVGL